jgi:hypothetical protein
VISCSLDNQQFGELAPTQFAQGFDRELAFGYHGAIRLASKVRGHRLYYTMLSRSACTRNLPCSTKRMINRIR